MSSSSLMISSTSAVSLVRITSSMPFSICSIDVADAQRLARRVGERECRRRDRGRVEEARLAPAAARGGDRDEALTSAATRSVKQKKSTAIVTLKSTWK